MNEPYTINMPDYPNSDYENDLYGNLIHRTAVIGSKVEIGHNNVIHAYAVLDGYTIIGDNNVFFPFVSIGSVPEHRNFNTGYNAGVSIGDNNVFREYVTVNAGCYRQTTINNNIWMLRGSHAGHDVIIEDECTISCNVLIGGHSHILHRSNLGLGAILHQYSVIGGGSMIGMGSIITKTAKVDPFSMYVGNPAKFLKTNMHVLSMLDQDEIKRYTEKFEAAYQNRLP